MREMTQEEVKRHMAMLPKYLPEELIAEFMKFVGDFLVKWVDNAKKVLGEDDPEVPVGFFPMAVQAALTTAVAGIAEEAGHEPTPYAVTMLETLVKTVMMNGNLDFPKFLRSAPVKQLAEARRLLEGS